MSVEERRVKKASRRVHASYIFLPSYSPTTHLSSCAYTTTTLMLLFPLPPLPALSSSEATITHFSSKHVLNKHTLQYDRYPMNRCTQTRRYGPTSSSTLSGATSRYQCCCSSHGRASLSDEISYFTTSYSRGYCIPSPFVFCEISFQTRNVRG